MCKPYRACFAIAIIAVIALSATAEPVPSIAAFAAQGFPDNADLRGKLFAYVIGASRDVALKYGEKQLQSAAGPVTVRVENRSADFIVEFLNANSTDPNQAGRGSVFIQRGNGKGNYILQARIFLEDDPSCYLNLYPSGSGTRGDVVMYGAVVKKGLYFSDMLYRILLLSFADIVDATGRSFDWSAIFKFESNDSDGDSLSELRAVYAAAPGAAEQAPVAAASSAPIALGAATGRIALAAAPSLPLGSQADTAVKGPRSLRIATAVERAASAEALLLDLASAGESSAREFAIAPDAAPAFGDGKGDPMAKVGFADFPRYDSKGLPLAAIRAALYLDLQSNPGSIYALIGDGFRATVIPSFDEAGRLTFAFFSGGKEASWSDVLAAKRDFKARIVRIPPAS